jgi:cellobiose transport system permease protein
MYEKGWMTGALGQASAIAWVMLLLLLLIGAVRLLVTRLNRDKSTGDQGMTS